jgi:hypothetical protein
MPAYTIHITGPVAPWLNAKYRNAQANMPVSMIHLMPNFLQREWQQQHEADFRPLSQALDERGFRCL